MGQTLSTRLEDAGSVFLVSYGSVWHRCKEPQHANKDEQSDRAREGTSLNTVVWLLFAGVLAQFAVLL